MLVSGRVELDEVRSMKHVADLLPWRHPIVGA
jgi:hypothetical protein